MQIVLHQIQKVKSLVLSQIKLYCVGIINLVIQNCLIRFNHIIVGMGIVYDFKKCFFILSLRFVKHD